MDLVLELHSLLPLILFMQIINERGLKSKLILAVNSFQNLLPAGVIPVPKAYIRFDQTMLYYRLATDSAYFTICKLYLIRLFPGHVLRFICIDLLVNGEESVYHQLCEKERKSYYVKSIQLHTFP